MVGFFRHFHSKIENLQPCYQNNRVWLDCEGENPADKENLGPVVYHPTRGISANYFPFLNQQGYLSPAVFVEFTQPKRKTTLVKLIY